MSMMSIEINPSIESRTQAFATRLKWYLDQTKIPWTWFAQPDYTAITAANIAEFDQMVKSPEKEFIIFDREDEERFSVAAKIAGSLDLGRLGSLRWVEISEPTPEEQNIGLIGARSMQFYTDELEKTRYFLGIRGIPYEIIEDEDHAQINVVFDPEGNSFQLANKSMDAIASARVRTGKAQVLKLNP